MPGWPDQDLRTRFFPFEACFRVPPPDALKRMARRCAEACRRCVARSFRERQRGAARASRPARNGFRGDGVRAAGHRHDAVCRQKILRIRELPRPSVTSAATDHARVSRRASRCLDKVHNRRLGYPQIIPWIFDASRASARPELPLRQSSHGGKVVEAAKEICSE